MTSSSIFREPAITTKSFKERDCEVEAEAITASLPMMIIMKSAKRRIKSLMSTLRSLRRHYSIKLRSPCQVFQRTRMTVLPPTLGACPWWAGRQTPQRELSQFMLKDIWPETIFHSQASTKTLPTVHRFTETFLTRWWKHEVRRKQTIQVFLNILFVNFKQLSFTNLLYCMVAAASTI